MTNVIASARVTSDKESDSMANLREKDLNFEINLLPVISLLAVLISFLLLTAVWVSVGSLKFSQAYGTSTAEEKEVTTLTAQLENDGRLFLMLKDADAGKADRWDLAPIGSEINWQEYEQKIDQLVAEHPDLKTATILPDKNVRYQNVIRLMEYLKKKEIRSIGISTL
jgi:biopolymer transport protein ExbD